MFSENPDTWNRYPGTEISKLPYIGESGREEMVDPSEKIVVYDDWQHRKSGKIVRVVDFLGTSTDVSFVPLKGQNLDPAGKLDSLPPKEFLETYQHFGGLLDLNTE